MSDWQIEDGMLQQKEFLKEWPIQRLKNMSLEEYTNLDRETSFIYWIEKRTEQYASIWGGSAFKFGIYKRLNTSKWHPQGGVGTDGIYGWRDKYGNTVEEVFKSVKSILLDIAQFSSNGELEKIDKLDLGEVVKWKVACLYNAKLIPILKKEVLIRAAYSNGFSDAYGVNYSELQRFLITKRPKDSSSLEFAESLWKEFNLDNFYFVIDKFLKQSQTENLKRKGFPKYYKDLKVRVSFGTGNVARISWIAFLNYPNTVTRGIYPVYLYFKSENLLVLSFGLSETETPKYSWPHQEKYESIKSWFQKNEKPEPARYGSSFVKSVYDLSEELDPKKIQQDLNEIIEEYSKIDFGSPELNAEHLSMDGGYWIFQGNPKVYDIVSALEANDVSTWSVKAHKKDIKIGDKIIIWVTGKKQGCYALGEVASDVYESLDDEGQMKYYTSKSANEIADRVKIRITHNLAPDRISKSDINKIDELAKLKVGNQGTNFSATEEEYNALLELIEGNTGSFDSFLKKFDKKDLESYFGFLREIIEHFNLSPEDERLAFSTRMNRRLHFIVGQRSVFCLFLKQAISRPKGKFRVLSKLKITENSEPFPGKSPQPFLNYYSFFSPTSDDKKSIFDAIKYELDRTKKSGFRKHNNADFINYVFGLTPSTKTTSMTFPLNTILYGPPGTGKTYKVKNEYFEKFTIKENTLTKSQYLESIVNDLTWWQVISIAVLDINTPNVNEIFNHEFTQKKLELSNSKSVRQTIWGQLQSHTVFECENVNVEKRTEPLLFYKRKNSTWTVNKELLDIAFPEAFKHLNNFKSYVPNPENEIKNYEFITFHQSFAYEDFIEGIKPVLDDENNELRYEVKDGIFKRLCLRAKINPDLNFAIFIDEINRGNVSAIFGELITLIEIDKRLGAKNELKAILPYSKQEFGVPKNLFIYGTMNTADRSVEALDTALRRRFSFIEMNPEPSKLSSPEFKCTGVDLEALLNAMNARIEKLLDKDYCIGHSYFMTINNRKEPLEEIKSIFQNKILPLLQEYFYGDWGKIMLVIGGEFVEMKKETINFLSTNNYEDFEEYDEKPIYNFTNPSNWTLASFKSIYEQS